MAKAIKISADGGTTFATLPGNTGELTSEGNNIDDTVYGASYRSGQPGMIGWNIAANGLYKGFAGYVADLLITGTSTLMTAEAMTLLSGKTYEVTAATKRVFDPDAALTILDNAIAVSPANILNIDYVWGRVTFVSGYTVVGPVTVTAHYLPTAVIARANGFTLTQTADAVDDTDYETAQTNDGHRVFIPGLKTVELSLTGIWNIANDWRSRLVGRERILVQVNPDGNLKSVARGFFRPITMGQSGDVGAQEAATATFALSVPDIELMAPPFSWHHTTDTTLNLAIRHALAAYTGDLIYDYQYLANGVNGYEGEGIITDLSLTGGLDVMHEFTVNVQGSGALSPVP